MAARGHYLGAIIDDLDTISSRVRARCQFGYTDLNRVLEDFFKELLNLVDNANLKNLNAERRNAPGLDLGDATSPVKRAYQVTSQASARKVNDTLAKIDDTALETYDEFYVLVLGERQGSYSLKKALVRKTGFEERNVIGMTELAARVMACDLATIRAVHEKLREELRRVTIELEHRPGETQSSALAGMVEETPDIQRSDMSLLADHPDVEGLFESHDEARAALDAFISRLARLPRMTREYFGWMIDNSDYMYGHAKRGAFGHSLSINADLVERKHHDRHAMMADLRLLRAWDFADYEDEQDGTSPRFDLYFPGTDDTNFREAFSYFMKAEELSARTLFQTMNFTAFGPAPATPATVSAKPNKKTTKRRTKKKSK